MMASSSSSKGRLSSYSVVKAIGKGSYGEVFLVKHAREKKQVSMNGRMCFSVLLHYLWVILAGSSHQPNW